MKCKLLLVLTVLIAAAPAFAESSKPHSTGGHIRPQLFHDRSSHIHNHGSQPHHQA